MRSIVANTKRVGEEVHRANSSPVAPAGGVYEAWVARYNGPGNWTDQARAIGIDNSGNVYVAGSSWGSGTNYDYAIIKYNSAGQEQWVARYNGPDNGDDQLKAMVVDGAGNVYVTGRTAVNDPYVDDSTTIKYNSDGQQMWVARYNVQPSDYVSGEAIAVDSSGNVYVAAFTTFYRPHPRFCSTIKYNSAGQQQWVAEYHGGTNHDEPAAIAVDGASNVYVTGGTQACPDAFDYQTLKYNSAGQQQWVGRYNGGSADDFAAAIAVDASGNIYVTGESFGTITSDYATIKYNPDGQEQWVARFDQGGGDAAHALAVDPSGNVYVTGEIRDPDGYPDYGTIKYNSAGQQQWVARYNGPVVNGSDVATAIALDAAGNVYVTGSSQRIDVYSADYATIKYDSAGQQLWIARYSSPGDARDSAVAIAVDKVGNVYVTGRGGSGFDGDYVTVKYAQGPTLTPASIEAAKASPTTTAMATASPAPNSTTLLTPSGFGTPTPTPSPTPTPQTCCQHITTTATGTIVPGTVDIGNHCDNCLTLVSFPFPVQFYDSIINQAYVNSNGSLLFTDDVAYYRTACPLPDRCLNRTILVYQDDLRTDGPGDGVFTSISGTAPNRVFNIEWRTSYFGRTGTANFEVRFYENQTFFDMIYGATTENGASAESGVQQSAGGGVCNATTYSCHAPSLTNGLKVTYQSWPCGVPTSTPTVTPTNTPTSTSTPTETPRPRLAPIPRARPSPAPRP